MSLSIYTADAFSKSPFAGNPAAVCLLEEDISDKLKQQIASEMNLSETAFVTKSNPLDNFQSAGRFGLRWFTPANEVSICGHATLATAAVLYQCIGNSNYKLEFDTKSGVLTTRKDEAGRVVISLPCYPPVGLGKDEAKVEKLVKATVHGLPVQEVKFSEGIGYLLVRLKDSCSRQEFAEFKPNFDLMFNSDGTGKIIVLIVTCKDSEGSYDFVSRCFAPWVGTLEDPVCGSAHAVLAPYWSKELGKDIMLARQCSSRGGEILVKMAEDGRVEISGHAAVVLKGQINVQQ